MNIVNLINLLKEMEDKGVKDVAITQESMKECVYNEFRTTNVWLDGFNGKDEFVTCIEIDVKD